MSKLRIYTYKNCDTCRKATRWLKDRNVEFTEMPIREQPPTKEELKAMLANYGGDIRRLFNTSGQDYKAMNLKDKLAGMREEKALGLLAKNGNLVKRPFLLKGRNGVVGFNEEEWSKILES